MAESNSADLPSQSRRLPSLANANEFYAHLGHLLSLDCRPEEPAIYLLGSQVDGMAVTSSDVDLAIVFAKPIDTATRTRVARLIADLQESMPLLLDFVIIDERDLTAGLTPNLIRTRLLAGPDLLVGRPLRPLQGIILYYIGLVMVFSHLIRASTTGRLALPLTAPEPHAPYLGYTRNGIRIGKHEYRPGLNLLLKLVVAIASFRLAFLKGIITINRHDVVIQYGAALANDPWWPMLRDLYELARGEHNGELPTTEDGRTKLAACCRQVIVFENAFLVDAMTNLPAWLPWADAGFVEQVAGWAAGTNCSVPAYREKLEAIKAALKLREPTPPAAS